MLFTVTEFRARTAAEVNYVIRRRTADEHDNVRVVDWAERTRDADAELLGDDGLHLSDAGREALAGMIATDARPAPAGSAGDCLRTAFTDDSAVRHRPTRIG